MGKEKTKREMEGLHEGHLGGAGPEHIQETERMVRGHMN